MKKILAAGLFLVLAVQLHGQSSERDMKQLLSYSKKAQIDSVQFFAALTSFKRLEAKRELDVGVRTQANKEGGQTVQQLFNNICLHCTNPVAVNEFIKFMERQHGSADEQIPFGFERLFAKWPEYVLNRINDDKFLLKQLEWGFVNNHYEALKSESCETVFYGLNPKMRKLYPHYKKQIDYLLTGAKADLKN